jgi:hypothetical protein
MVLLFNYFNGRFWREMVISTLDPWSMLELLKTSKQLNKHKSYIYMLIYQKISLKHYEEIATPCIIKYNPYLEYSIYCSKEHLITLLKHNRSLRAMMEKYIKSHKNRRCMYINYHNEVTNYEKLLTLLHTP